MESLYSKIILLLLLLLLLLLILFISNLFQINENFIVKNKDIPSKKINNRHFNDLRNEYENLLKKILNTRKPIKNYRKITTDFKNNPIGKNRKSCINKYIIQKAKPFYNINELDNNYKYYYNIQKNIKSKYNNKTTNIIYPFNYNHNYFNSNFKIEKDNLKKYSHHILAGYNHLNDDNLTMLKKKKPKILNIYSKPLSWNCQRSFQYSTSPYNLSKKYS